MASLVSGAAPVAPGLCPGCGWAVRSDQGDDFTCARCAYLARRPRAIGTDSTPPKPMTKSERLFLAVLLLQDECPGGPAVDAQLMQCAARLLTRRLAPPTPFSGGPGHQIERPPRAVDELPPIPANPLGFVRVPLGTSPEVLRGYLSQLTAAWRAADCPVR